MPRLDSTGPIGAGPGTGRGLGRCGNADVREGGRGGRPRGGRRGRCFGGRGLGGRSWPWSSSASPSPSEEADVLRADLAAAEEQITALKARLEELDKRAQGR